MLKLQAAEAPTIAPFEGEPRDERPGTTSRPEGTGGTGVPCPDNVGNVPPAYVAAVAVQPRSSTQEGCETTRRKACLLADVRCHGGVSGVWTRFACPALFTAS
jgi:hypothetical protein